MSNQKNIYTIPPGEDFLRVLATYIFELVRGDMFELSKVRVILPNRRSSLKLKDEFVKLSPSGAVLLPQIFSLAEMDGSQPEILDIIAAEDIVPVISSERRLMLLAEMIIRNSSGFGLSEINFDAALKLSHSLAALVDDMEKHGLGIDALEKILPDELSQHRQVSLELIRFIFAEYPKLLSMLGVMDHARKTNKVLDLYSGSLQQNGAGSYIFLAGSTGSIPATRRLIRSVSRLEKGYVILPYIDLELNSFEWEDLGSGNNRISHQKHLHDLLRFIEVTPSSVRFLVPGGGVRQKTISNLMRSASTLQSWRNEKGADLDWIKLISAQNPVHEAKIISAIIRHKAGEGNSVALITNNSDLGWSVRLYLRRLGIGIDDSSGITLDRTAEGRFLIEVAGLISGGFRITSLLSLLKNDLVQIDKNEMNRFEKDFIRENNIRFLSEIFERSGDVRLSRNMNILLQRIFTTSEASATFTSLLNKAYSVIEILAPQRERNGIWQEIDMLLGNFSAAAEHAVRTSQFADAVRTILATGKTWPPYIPNRDIAILSPMEARLQHFDCVILGDMTLTSWPAGKFSPWFSRNMFRSMELPFEEDAISLAAHDFSSHLHQREVFMTHSLYDSGEPLIESPFISRLKAFYKAVTGREIPSDETYNNIIETLDGNFGPRKNTVLPAPRLPAGVRMNRLSVTKIETLLKNPYAVYASEILKLRKLDDLEKEPEAAEYGNFCHKVLEEFTRYHGLDTQKINIDSFSAIARKTHEEFSKKNLSNEAWVTQVNEIGNWFVDLEKEDTASLKKMIPEFKAEMRIDDFILVSKPDRIEITKDDIVNIADYKTGRFAGEKQVGRLVSPQIPLEAYMIKCGAFPEVPVNYKPGNIIYYNFSFSGNGPEKMIYSKIDLEKITDDVERELKNLIADLNDPGIPYLIRPNPKLQPDFDDYEHLERIEK